MKKYIIFTHFILYGLFVAAQDPHFTQFYAAPLTVNPAYTGLFDGHIRAVCNFRQQWISSANPIKTTVIQLDAKVGKEDRNDSRPLSVGILFMNDNTMKGVFTSNYITGAGSYHINLDEDGLQKLGLGFAATYGSRRLDYSKLSFEDQFVSYLGFNQSLPNNESGLNNMIPFFSFASGLVYIYDNEDNGTYFDLGVSGFHLNKPKQSAIKDKSQYLPERYSAQASLQQYLGEGVLLNAKLLYQNQAAVKYFLCGASISKMIGANKDNMVGAGLWYRSKDAISPYFLFEYSRMQFGFTYDIVSSDLKNGPKPSNSMEFSLQVRMNDGKKSN